MEEQGFNPSQPHIDAAQEATTQAQDFEQRAADAHASGDKQLATDFEKLAQGQRDVADLEDQDAATIVGKS